MSEGPLYSRAFVLVFATHLLHSLALYGYLHLPGFLAERGADELTIGMVVGTMAAAALVLRPLVGRLLDSRGRRLLVRWGSVLHAAVTLMYLGIDGVGPALYVVRALHGVAQAVLFAALFTVAADVVPPSRRTQGLALFGVSGLLPMSLAGLIGDAILAWAGYFELFVATALAAALGVAVAWAVEDSRRPARAGAPAARSFFVAALVPALRPLWLLSFSFGIGISSYTTFLRTFVDHAGVGSMGLFYSVYATAAIVLRIALGWVPDRVGLRRTAVPAMAASVVGLLVLRGAASDLDVALAGLLTGTGHAFLFPILTALVVVRAEDHERGAALSMFTASFDLGMLAGAPVLGAVLERTSYGTMFGGAAAVIVVGAVAWGAWDRTVVPPRRR